MRALNQSFGGAADAHIIEQSSDKGTLNKMAKCGNVSSKTSEVIVSTKFQEAMNQACTWQTKNVQ